MLKESQDRELSDLRADAELEKLKLEIEGLRRGTRWEGRITQYIPLITAIVAVGGLLAAILQFQSTQTLQQNRMIVEQQKDRAVQELDRVLRMQNQIRTDTDQLLQFTNDERQTVSRMSFLLDDLRSLLDQPIEHPEISDFVSRSRETVTKSLIRMIHYDCNFSERPRDVYFAAIVLDRWPNYSEFLSNNLPELDSILRKYVIALRDLHKKNPRYFQQLKYDVVEEKYDMNSHSAEASEHQRLHYGDVVIGFANHLNLVKNDSLFKRRFIEEFQSTVQASELTKQLFSEYTAVKSDQVGAFLFQPIAVSRGSGTGKINQVVLGPGIVSVLISVEMSDGADDRYPAYRASIRSASSGVTIWSSNEIKMNRRGVLTMKLEAGRLHPDDYILSVAGLSNEAPVELNRYLFRVVHTE